MTISIVKTHKDHNHYEVTLYDDKIQTLVTHCPSMVESWLLETQRIHRRRLHLLIVGIGFEWLPNCGYIEHPIAILQLCIGHRCLIFQILHAPSIPPSLVTFLGNASYTFVGFNIEEDVDKLMKQYGIRVMNVVDLSYLAAKELGATKWSKAGFTSLAREVLEIKVEKPERVCRSSWDDKWLTPAQVQYACVDAFVAFEIGRSLDASGGFWEGFVEVFENLGYFLFFIFVLKNLGFGWYVILFMVCLLGTCFQPVQRKTDIKDLTLTRC